MKTLICPCCQRDAAVLERRDLELSDRRQRVELCAECWKTYRREHSCACFELREVFAEIIRARNKREVRIHYCGRTYRILRRDAQRSKVYAAERAVDWKLYSIEADVPVEDGSIEAAARYIKRVMATETWKKVCGKANTVRKQVDVVAGAGSNASANRVTLSRWGRRPWVILHELAHVATDVGANHHWPFCATYVELVSMFVSRAAADALEAEFKRKGIRFRAPKTVSPERAAALRAQGFRLAELARARKAELSQDPTTERR